MDIRQCMWGERLEIPEFSNKKVPNDSSFSDAQTSDDNQH